MLGHFFTANEKTDAETKSGQFLSVIGPATYKLLRNLVSPDKTGGKTFNQHVEALAKHFKLTLSKIVE